MPTVLIICGGLGSRLKDLYPELPKPLIEANGKPFIEWILLAFILKGFKDFVFAAGYLSEKIQAWTENLNYKDCTFKVIKEDSPLGTGGAILNALHLCSDEIIVTNGDSLLLFDFLELKNHLTNHQLVIAGRTVSDCSRYGSLEINDHQQLVKFVEKRPGRGLVNGGIYCFNKSLLSKFECVFPISMEMQIIPSLLTSLVKIYAYDVGDAPFIDIGTPDALKSAGAFLNQQKSFWKIN